MVDFMRRTPIGVAFAVVVALGGTSAWFWWTSGDRVPVAAPAPIAATPEQPAAPSATAEVAPAIEAPGLDLPPVELPPGFSADPTKLP
jgi:hypothetical protein